MAAFTITPTAERQAAVQSYAEAQGTTEAALSQAQYDETADRLIENTYNSWWNGLTIAAKKGLYDAQ
jgi:hypothetical protein